MRPLRIARLPLGLVALVLLCLTSAEGRAADHRLAIVVGNNVGASGRAALRFAEDDATRMARVLVEMGGFSADDVYLLRGRDVATARRALTALRQRTATLKGSQGGGKVEVIFYFSGHSDGRSLEFGNEAWPFESLRQEIAATNADIRVTILDSCKSGALIASKGGTPGAGFEIRLTDALASTGEALLASSAREESALESAEIGGSFFSHHLISGLRGAADMNTDGRVTLGEAYQYAFRRTLAETSKTIYGPQHPTYDYRMSGEGDLVLSSMARAPSVLGLPVGFDRFLVASTGSHDVVVDLNAAPFRPIALPAGPYLVRAWRAAEAYEAHVDLPPSGQRTLAVQDLRRSEVTLAAAKGDVRSAVPPVDLATETAAASSVGMAVLGGVGSGFGNGAVGGARLVVDRARRSAPTGAQLAVEVSARGIDRGSQGLLLGGYRWGFSPAAFGHRTSVWGELQAGGGFIRGAANSTASADAVTSSLVTAIAPAVGGEVSISDRMAVRLEVEAAVQWMARAGELVRGTSSSAWLGVATRF